tara:strand:- start:270 stop:641 length:372 start_codon:yes stop_codon:yes gene_type:complete
MKNIFSLFLLMFISVFSNAQNADKLLLNSYSSDELQELKLNDSEKYELLLYGLDHATYFAVYDKDKHGRLELEELPELTELPSFADLKVKIESQNQYFYAPKLKKMLVVKSEWVLKNEKSNQK